MLIDKEMTKTEMRIAIRISSLSLAKLGKEENVMIEVMLRICKALDCDDLFQVVEIEKMNYY